MWFRKQTRWWRPCSFICPWMYWGWKKIKGKDWNGCNEEESLSLNQIEQNKDTDVWKRGKVDSRTRQRRTVWRDFATNRACKEIKKGEAKHLQLLKSLKKKTLLNCLLFWPLHLQCAQRSIIIVLNEQPEHQVDLKLFPLSGSSLRPHAPPIWAVHLPVAQIVTIPLKKQELHVSVFNLCLIYEGKYGIFYDIMCDLVILYGIPVLNGAELAITINQPDKKKKETHSALFLWNHHTTCLLIPK